MKAGCIENPRLCGKLGLTSSTRSSNHAAFWLQTDARNNPVRARINNDDLVTGRRRDMQCNTAAITSNCIKARVRRGYDFNGRDRTGGGCRAGGLRRRIGRLNGVTLLVPAKSQAKDQQGGHDQNGNAHAPHHDDHATRGWTTRLRHLAVRRIG